MKGLLPLILRNSLGIFRACLVTLVISCRSFNVHTAIKWHTCQYWFY
jgi:hypothetical protein